jgi:hypothetical protein
VEAPQGRIQTSDHTCGEQLAIDERADIGEAGVDGVFRRACRALAEGELGWEKTRPSVEEGGSGSSLLAQETRKIGRQPGCALAIGKCGEGTRFKPVVVGVESLEQAAAIGDLGLDKLPGQGERRRRIAGALVLEGGLALRPSLTSNIQTFPAVLDRYCRRPSGEKTRPVKLSSAVFVTAVPATELVMVDVEFVPARLSMTVRGSVWRTTPAAGSMRTRTSLWPLVASNRPSGLSARA